MVQGKSVVAFASKNGKEVVVDPIAEKELELAKKRKRKEELERALEEEQAEQDRILAEIEQKKNEKREAELKARMVELEELAKDEAYYLELAQEVKAKRERISEEKRQFFAVAIPTPVEEVVFNYTPAALPEMEATKEEEGDVVVPTKKKRDWWKPVGKFLEAYMPFVQVVLLLGLIGAFLGGFYYYEEKISNYNASLSDEELMTKKVNAFNDANLQRIVFERFLQSTDLLLLFVFLLVIAPSILCYVLPFARSPKDFYHEFYYKLSSWQRVIVFVVMFCSLLIYFGLGHTVNQF